MANIKRMTRVASRDRLILLVVMLVGFVHGIKQVDGVRPEERQGARSSYHEQGNHKGVEKVGHALAP